MTGLRGCNWIAGAESAEGTSTFQAVSAGAPLEPRFAEATAGEIDRAVRAADAAVEVLSKAPAATIAALLEAIAAEIEAVGDTLIERASLETSLPVERLKGERGRTTNQLRMFAGLVREGAWKSAHVDPALPDRQPARRPDLRRTVIPVGAVAVWSASNFPLAFSVAGGDTASAFAAGCPVIVKAHPAHPGTSELTAQSIMKAIASVGLPPGCFSLLQGASPEVSLRLVEHPRLAAGAFTGSLRAGRALFDAAARRAVPILFFAEMGSVNPVFLLSGALEQRGDVLAAGLFQSVTLGVGQFCTCPGVVMGVAGSAFEKFSETLRAHFQAASSGPMLTEGIARAYKASTHAIAELPGISAAPAAAADRDFKGSPALFETTAESFLKNEALRHEVFGPSTILVRCETSGQMITVARELEGSLTATLHGTEADFEDSRDLVSVLVRKAGRLVFNGFPTGVEVCAAMHHGGPYPATTDSRFTSVGTAAIQRFARPICFQDCPPALLPPELCDGGQ